MQSLSKFVEEQMATRPLNEMLDEVLSKYDGVPVTKDNIEDIYESVARVVNSNRARRGSQFERTIQSYLVNAFKDKGIYVYSQVPVKGSNAKIDFVVSKEDTSKDKLNLLDAVIVSCKVSLRERWRVDQHLYNQCKQYYLVTMDEKLPHESMPANVHFVSTKITSQSESLCASILDALGAN